MLKLLSDKTVVYQLFVASNLAVIPYYGVWVFMCLCKAVIG